LILALVTLALFIAAVVAARWAKRATMASRRLYAIERRRDRVAAVDREERAAALVRAQAAKVSAWFQSRPMYDDPADGAVGWQAGAQMLNLSELPIYKAVLSFVPIKGGVGQVIEIDEPVAPMTEPTWVPLGILTGDEFQVRLAFTDSAGQRWERRPDGLLVTVVGSAEIAGRGAVTAFPTVIPPEPTL
jgi:hypothetical protein